MKGVWKKEKTQLTGCCLLKMGFLNEFITQQLKEGPEEQLWAAKQDKPLCPEMWHLGTAAVAQRRDVGSSRAAWELVWGLQMGAQLSVGQQDVCLILELPFCSRDGSLQSSKPELIPAGVFKKCLGHFSPPVPSLYCGTLCGSLGIKIFGQCVCVFALWAQSCSILSSLKFYGKQRQNQTSLA